MSCFLLLLLKLRCVLITDPLLSLPWPSPFSHLFSCREMRDNSQGHNDMMLSASGPLHSSLDYDLLRGSRALTQSHGSQQPSPMPYSPNFMNERDGLRASFGSPSGSLSGSGGFPPRPFGSSSGPSTPSGPPPPSFQQYPPPPYQQQLPPPPLQFTQQQYTQPPPGAGMGMAMPLPVPPPMQPAGPPALPPPKSVAEVYARFSSRYGRLDDVEVAVRCPISIAPPHPLPSARHGKGCQCLDTS